MSKTANQLEGCVSCSLVRDSRRPGGISIHHHNYSEEWAGKKPTSQERKQILNLAVCAAMETFCAQEMMPYYINVIKRGYRNVEIMVIDFPLKNVSQE